MEKGDYVYSKKVMEHFLNPKNMGKIENANGVGKVGNVICGDTMYIYVKVKNNVIENIGFETMGCVAAIATSSMITELVKGKTLDEALKIGRNDISNSLETLPPIKEHCSNLAADGLHEAIYDYLTKSKKPVPDELKKEHERILKTLTHEHD